MKKEVRKAFIKKYKFGSSRQILCCKEDMTLELPKNKNPKDTEEIDKDTNWFNKLEHNKPLNDEIETDFASRGFVIEGGYMEEKTPLDDFANELRKKINGLEDDYTNALNFLKEKPVNNSLYNKLAEGLACIYRELRHLPERCDFIIAVEKTIKNK